MEVLNKFTVFALATLLGLTISSEIPQPICSSDHAELWPHTNLNKFWYCDHNHASPKEISCDTGRGFIREENRISGCIPFEDWECTSKSGPPSCDGANFDKPHRHLNPNMFWACDENRKPVEAKCLDFPIEDRDNPTYGTRGFVENENNLGCVPWNVWVCGTAGNDRRI